MSKLSCRTLALPACLTLVSVFGNSAIRGQSPRATDDRFAPVHQLLQDYVNENKIAGAVALVSERDRIVIDDAVGWQDADAKQPMKKDALFRIASMTKPITSVALMMLVEDGKVNLKDPLSTFVPEFRSVSVIEPGTNERKPAGRPITIHDLLTQTSGLTYGFFGQEPHGQLYADSGISQGLGPIEITLEENTRRLAKLPLTQQPGSGWQYGMSTDVLGRVIEVASGQPFDEFVRQRILLPLRMRDTHFVVPDGKRDRLATLYRPQEDGTITPAEAASPAGDSPRPPAGPYRSGGAGLVSTAPDYLRFLTMLLNGGELDGVRLLKPETVAQMTSNQIGELSIFFPIHGDKFGYGFGVHSVDGTELNGASPGTYSWGGIFHTYFWVDPKQEVVGVLMTQLAPFDHLTLWADFQNEVYETLEATLEPAVSKGPQAGNVYREFAVHNGGNLDWRVTSPRATATGAWQFLPNPVLKVELGDLKHAVRAEAVIDRWGGHLKTTDKRIRFNGNTWLRIPELATTPGDRAEYYYAQDNPVINVPLDHLQGGVNTLDGTCSTRENYNWGQWGLYSLILRVYQDKRQVDHPTAAIVSPSSGATIGDNPTISVRASLDVRQVQVLAYYDGDDEDGDGVFQDWHGAHHQLARGEPADLSGHVGTSVAAPFEVTWDTAWVPDQQPGSVKLIARVESADGVWTVTEPIENLTLERTDRHVAALHATEVPEHFGVRTGREESCTFTVPADLPLGDHAEAVLSLRTWHGWDGHHEPLSFNDHTFPIDGNNHHYDIDRLPIPTAALRHGKNTFMIKSDTEHHMLEVLWPGPVLLMRTQTR